MVVLWIMVLLTALATEFVSAMKTEVHTTRNFKEDIESHNLARAGINLAMAEILQTALFHSYNNTVGFIVGKPAGTNPEPGTDSPSTGNMGNFKLVQRNDIPLGSGTVSYSIQDENGKVNLNTATRDQLVKVLTVSGLEIGELRDTIADSILDWIDKDEDTRLNGAESKYYLSLNPPYRAKNGDFYTVDELIKIRGVTEEILYGSKQAVIDNRPRYLGLDKFFTVQNVNTFNPNTASPQLLSLYYSEDQAQQILLDREEKGYSTIAVSTHFKITSTGKINNSQTTHTIVAIIEKIGNDSKSTLIARYWNDNATTS